MNDSEIREMADVSSGSVNLINSDSNFSSPSHNHRNVTPVMASPTSLGSISPSSMSSPFFKPNEARFLKPDEVSFISNFRCNSMIEDSTVQSLLIIDLRPYTEYVKSHIKNALHISLPSTLLKRKSFTFEKLIDNLSEMDQLYLKENIENNFEKILLYDGFGGQQENFVSLACYNILIKLLAYLDNVRTPQNRKNVTTHVLESGFDIFSITFPEKIDDERVDNTSNYSDEWKNVNATNLKLSVPDRVNKNVPLSSSISNESPKFRYKNDTDSPISSASPISALLKFQLPSSTNNSSYFKFSQNEEVMNLESYLSAVDLKESETLRESHADKISMDSFTFPKNKVNEEANEAQETPKKKTYTDEYQLNFQKKYKELCKNYTYKEIDEVVPKWFQDSMKRNKLEFITNFQKLDYLEKKRLNKCLNHKASYSISKLAKKSPRIFDMEADQGSKSTDNHPMIQTRSLSHPNPVELSTINDEGHKRYLLKSMDLDYDEDESSISISCGVELGTKNRYKDIFPYEHSRVVLRKFSVPDLEKVSNIDNEITENYINANYLDLPKLIFPSISEVEIPMMLEPATAKRINSSSSKIRYIATQAPMLATVHDFFTCIINNNVPLILSLTNTYENGIEKCFEFWKEGHYGGIQIELIQESLLEMDDDTIIKSGLQGKDLGKIYIRRLKLNYMMNEKPMSFITLQLQIVDWPDLGLLSDPTEMIQAINLKNAVIEKLFLKKLYTSDQTPTILVHCSAGCGRTGTWCTVDSVISNTDMFESLHVYQLQSKKGYQFFDPVVWTINMFRKQRVSMVQTVNQFLFIYECLLCYFALKLHGSYKEDANKVKCHRKYKSMDDLLLQIRDLDVIDKFVDEKTREPRCSFA